MCRQVTCKTCGKKAWAGCGQHVEEALRGVQAADRCPGHEKERGTGFFARLFGR